MSDVAAQAERWRTAREWTVTEKRELVELVRAANVAGASEYELAKAAGVTRMTIRNWLGKPTR